MRVHMYLHSCIKNYDPRVRLHRKALNIYKKLYLRIIQISKFLITSQIPLSYN